jgi:predicted lipoprotein with Yx(FWY)xxD motif
LDRQRSKFLTHRHLPQTMLALTLAATASLAFVAIAIAKTVTLQVAKNAKVTNTQGMTSHENIAVSKSRFALYTLSGDSKSHPECTKKNNCFAIWPPLTVGSSKNLSATAGIHGKLGVWRRNGFMQLTLAGHPLYMYAGDNRTNAANGEGIRSFGGVWHVIKASSQAPKSKRGLAH